MQKVTLLIDENGPFSIDGNATRVAQFPPGMSFTTSIRFKAEDDKFYYHKLVFVTRNSRFVIPIMGKPLIDWPFYQKVNIIASTVTSFEYHE